MNNPIRAFLQSSIEVKEFRKLSKLPKDMNVLEIGCGNGLGTKLIMQHFAPKEICAIDLDPNMIQKAKKTYKYSNVFFSVGDATHLSFPDNSFNAVFDFGIIHHIPNWKDCLNELKRVLKPGGQLLIEDGSIETFSSTLFGKILRKLLAHPYDDMYTRSEFVSYLKSIGFSVAQYRLHNPLELTSYFTLIANK